MPERRDDEDATASNFLIDDALSLSEGSVDSERQMANAMNKPIWVTPTPEQRECGEMCWLVTTTKNSSTDFTWFVVPATPAVHNRWLLGIAPPSGTEIYVGTSPGGSQGSTTICLDPINFPPGTYVVAALRTGSFGGSHWIWSEWATISFNPSATTTLQFEIDGRSGWDLGQFPCDSPLILKPREQKCLAQYRIRVMRWHNNAAWGPQIWLTGPAWIGGPLGSVDLRQLAAANGYDFVPGQCYLIDVFSHLRMNGSQWYSAGTHFCLDCCCDDGKRSDRGKERAQEPPRAG